MRKILFALIATTILTHHLTMLPGADPAPRPSRIGKSGPVWTELMGVDGNKHSAKELKSKFVVVALIANHCTLCQFQEKELIKIQTDYRDKDV